MKFKSMEKYNGFQKYRQIVAYIDDRSSLQAALIASSCSINNTHTFKPQNIYTNKYATQT